MKERGALGFVAGFSGLAIEKYLNDMGYEYALKLGTASGGATAFSRGLATKDEIYNLMEKI